MHGGEVIELVSDLGGGKTTFVKGLAKGIGSSDHVRSPSFTISNQYKAGGLVLHHFDFYRLTEAGIMQDELAEILTDSKNVVAIEWGDIVHNVLPSYKVTIKIQATGEDTRQISITVPEKLSYIVEDL